MHLPGLSLALFLTIATTPFVQEESPLHVRVNELVDFLEHEDADARAFVDASLAESLVERVGRDALADTLVALRASLPGAKVETYAPESERDAAVFVELGAGEPVELLVRLAPAPPHGIIDVWSPGRPALDPDAKRPVPPSPITWDTLDARLEDEAERGFAGAVALVRDGEVVLERGFGLANREKEIPVRADTIFAIGSTPIDFTKAAILMLWQDDVVDLDATIDAFFDDVPADKRGITLRHLMEGRSGLHDFHDLPGDRDVDHAWIDRAEAIRRILSFDLLFEPGTEYRHSHSAWGLVAAIVEIRSGLPYPEFTRELLFEPAGMQDTGFFGEPIPEERLAIGYGVKRDGEINAPPYWGPTSWLVMGSGGMVSTVGDLLRWNRALRSGKLLSKEALLHYWAPPGALLDGGDMYGFEIRYNEGPDDLFVLVSGAVDFANRRRFDRLARDLHALVSRP